jgi:ubiquinone/menaquinone biosynthesis methyltransferase
MGTVLPNPTSSSPKDRQVRQMFGEIAPTYDLLNRVLSLGIDQTWRTQACRNLEVPSPARVLDLCGGTGDFATQLLKARPRDEVHVADFCFPMLGKARDRLVGEGRPHGVLCGDALGLPFPSGSFDAALCGFGVRNWSNLGAGMREVHRVLRPGGEFAVLDFFQAESRVGDRLGRVYVRHILPTVGGLLSGNRSAYQYLADSMEGFLPPEKFAEECADWGFQISRRKRFMLGLCWLFILKKT